MGLHYIAVAKRLRWKQALIILISSALIIYLDHYSFVILTLLSTLLLILIKKRIECGKVIYSLTLMLIGGLLLIKDHWVLFDVDTIYIPLGLSYYYFRLLSLLIEYSRRPETYHDVDVWHYYTYIFFFPIFLAGPIQRFDDFKMVRSENFFRLYSWFFTALLLKLVIVDMLLFYTAYDFLLGKLKYVESIHYGYVKSVVLISLFGMTAFLHAYMDLMLYTEMSKALSRILGFTVQENFNKPLLASNISRFWQSWHMSLSNWTRDYIFFPTLIKTKKVWLSTYASMLTIGVWHSATLNWITWALLHATAINFYGKLRTLAIYRKLASHTAGRWSLRIIGNIVTIYFVSIVFVLVAIHDYHKAVSYILVLFGIGGGS